MPSFTQSPARRREELGHDLIAASLLRGRFVLRSGEVSNVYIDKYQLSTKPAILRRLAEALGDLVPRETDRLAGPELGAVAFVTAISLHLGLPSVFVRKQPKDYATGHGVEGELHAGERVCVIEDVLTTGTEALRTAAVLRSAGAVVVGIVAVLDREQGAAAALAAAGLHFRPLFKRSELGF
jgi:orotate phosphoribosyltransferase